MEPYNWKDATKRSEVKVVYDDKAIYICTILYDDQPDSIMKQYTPRDEMNISDDHGVYIEPFNTGLNAFGFLLNLKLTIWKLGFQ